MTKEQHQNLELPLAGNAKAQQSDGRACAEVAKASCAAWLSMTAGVAKAAAHAAAAARSSRAASS